MPLERPPGADSVSTSRLCAAAGFTFGHHPRCKLWSALLDLGESRLRASIYFSRNGDDPFRQQSLEQYCAGLDLWLRNLLEEWGLPDSAVSTGFTLLGSVGLSVWELEAFTGGRSSSSSSSSSSSEFCEVD